MSFFQEPPRLSNQYTDDRPLRSLLRRAMPAEVLQDIEPSLEEMGALAAGELLELASRFRTHEPVHIPYDPWGNRIDRVDITPAWEHFARVASEKGLVATAYERQHAEYSRLHQFALVYLFDRSTQVYTCPLAMTDGCARTLELLADEGLKKRILPHLLSRDPQTAWTSGQWMTERTGGSDVGISETVAKKDADRFRLYGTKWFTSAVTSQVALTLARPEGNPPGGKGLALFFVELRDAEGALQNIEVHRLKEKLGTRQLPTAELTLDGTPAIPLCGLSDGVRNMASMLNITRTWNAVCSVAGMRRCIALARDYAHKRHAFGSSLAQKPLHITTLADMAAQHEAALHMVFFAVGLLGKEENGKANSEEKSMLRLLQPLAKLLTGKMAVACASETLEAFAGAGYVEDTGLPELLRDAQVLSIWEGTTNVLALESLRAITRAHALAPLLARLQQAASTAQDSSLQEAARIAVAAANHAATWLEAKANDRDRLEAGAREFAMTLGRSMALALLIEHAQWSIIQEDDSRPAVSAQIFARRGIDTIQDAPVELDALVSVALDH